MVRIECDSCFKQLDQFADDGFKKFTIYETDGGGPQKIHSYVHICSECLKNKASFYIDFKNRDFKKLAE